VAQLADTAVLLPEVLQLAAMVATASNRTTTMPQSSQ